MMTLINPYETYGIDDVLIGEMSKVVLTVVSYKIKSPMGVSGPWGM
jgi:hypothetical protein